MRISNVECSLKENTGQQRFKEKIILFLCMSSSFVSRDECYQTEGNLLTEKLMGEVCSQRVYYYLFLINTFQAINYIFKKEGKKIGFESIFCTYDSRNKKLKKKGRSLQESNSVDWSYCGFSVSPGIHQRGYPKSYKKAQEKGFLELHATARCLEWFVLCPPYKDAWILFLHSKQQYLSLNLSPLSGLAITRSMVLNVPETLSDIHANKFRMEVLFFYL